MTNETVCKAAFLFLLAANILIASLVFQVKSGCGPGVDLTESHVKATVATFSNTSSTIGLRGGEEEMKTAVTTPPTPPPKQILQIEPCPRLGDAQSNQDCIIDKIFTAVGTTQKYYVEYGFNTNAQCSFSGPNTCRLWKTGQWNGLLLDGSHTNASINLHAHYLYSNNMVAILDKYQVPKELDFYSGDMDSHDYFVLKAVLDSGKYWPRVISVEYNMNFPMDWAISQVDPTIAEPLQQPPPYQFQDCIWGASPTAFRYLLERHGYVMVAVTKKLDLFWVRKDVLEANNLQPAASFEQLLVGKNTQPLHPQKSNSMFLSKLVDVKVYEETKSYRLANRAMVKTILNHIQSPNEGTINCLRNIPAAHVEAYLAEHPAIGSHLEL